MTPDPGPGPADEFELRAVDVTGPLEPITGRRPGGVAAAPAGPSPAPDDEPLERLLVDESLPAAKDRVRATGFLRTGRPGRGCFHT